MYSRGSNSTSPRSTVLLHENAQLEPADSQQQRQPRQRKPSPGLAARFKALGFGKESNKATSPSPSSERIGRIPEDQIRQLDHNHQAHRANSSSSQTRGRAWSGTSASGYLTPQVTGGSFPAGDSRVLEGGTRRPLSVA